MSIQKIIQEAINKNPHDLKEALEEELRDRIRLALEAKMSDEEDDDSSEEDDDSSEEDDEDDEDDEDMKKESVEQIDELDRKTLASYVKKADRSANKSFSNAIKQQSIANRTGSESADKKRAQHSKDFDKRATGIDRAKARLSKD